MKGGIVILVVLIVVMAVSLAVSASYPFLQAKIIPIIVCGVIFLLSAVELVRDVSNETKHRRPKEWPSPMTTKKRSTEK